MLKRSKFMKKKGRRAAYTKHQYTKEGVQCYEATKAGWESLFRGQTRFEKLEGVWERGVEELGFGHWRGLDDGGVPEEHVEEEEEVNLSLSLPPGDDDLQVARPWKQQPGQQNTVVEEEESEDEESESEEEMEEEEDDDGEVVGKDGARVSKIFVSHRNNLDALVQ